MNRERAQGKRWKWLVSLQNLETLETPRQTEQRKMGGLVGRLRGNHWPQKCKGQNKASKSHTYRGGCSAISIGSAQIWYSGTVLGLGVPPNTI